MGPFPAHGPSAGPAEPGGLPGAHWPRDHYTPLPPLSVALAVVLIKVMGAVVKANSTMQFEVNVAGLDEQEFGRPLFTACETKKKRLTSWCSQAYFFCTLLVTMFELSP